MESGIESSTDVEVADSGGLSDGIAIGDGVVSTGDIVETNG